MQAKQMPKCIQDEALLHESQAIPDNMFINQINFWTGQKKEEESQMQISSMFNVSNHDP